VITMGLTKLSGIAQEKKTEGTSWAWYLVLSLVLGVVGLLLVVGLGPLLFDFLTDELGIFFPLLVLLFVLGVFYKIYKSDNERIDDGPTVGSPQSVQQSSERDEGKMILGFGMWFIARRMGVHQGPALIVLPLWFFGGTLAVYGFISSKGEFTWGGFAKAAVIFIGLETISSLFLGSLVYLLGVQFSPKYSYDYARSAAVPTTVECYSRCGEGVDGANCMADCFVKEPGHEATKECFSHCGERRDGALCRYNCLEQGG